MVISIVLLLMSGESNLGPNHLSLLELEKWLISATTAFKAYNFIPVLFVDNFEVVFLLIAF